MMQHKRSPISIDQSSFMNLMPKRLKTDVTLSSKEKKEKVSERISALQQLVSPYGKTDTASVLLEAMEYINFLHEQVKVLSAPYLYSTPAQAQSSTLPVFIYYIVCDVLILFFLKGEEPCSLNSKGLCLVPISFTAGVVSSNGADIWAPIKTSHLNTRRSMSDEVSVVTHS
ncbi:UNVERIFIED_CONTAM: Transcription factor [Sesamum calycinum]|uniref:Transcription factor n=1 Tax=Sesamum calycinum TaxID=2727403 RepID=A0AAW2RAK2_9LAMI